MSTDISDISVAKKDGPWDVEAFKTHFANLSSEDKRLVVYWLLRDLLGDRPEKESDISDPDGFLYLHFVPPGVREYFRLLEHPEREEQMRKASMEPTFPHTGMWKEFGFADSDFE